MNGIWFGATWPTTAGNGNLTSWSYYSGSDLLQSKTDASGHAVTYSYAGAGLLQTRTWARGTVTTYGYNLAGELNSTSYSDGTTPVSIGYNNLGQRVSIKDAAGAHTLTYDALGQLQSDAVVAQGGGNPDALAGVTTTSSYLTGSVPLPGQLRNLQVQTAAGTIVNQALTYDPNAGRLSTVTDGTNLATYGYVGNSDMVGTVTISQGVNTVLTHSRVPDNLNRLSSVSAANAGGTVLESHTWTYDGSGHRTIDTMADGTSWTYGYDGREEVTSGSRQLGTSALSGYQFGYTFDAIGNRTQTTVNSRAANYTANTLNEYSQRDVPGAFDLLGSAPASSLLTISQNDNNNFGTLLTPTRQGSWFAATATLANSTSAVEKQVQIQSVLPGGNGLLPDYDTTVTGSVFLPATPEVFQYDFDGNLTQNGRWTYGWDGENRLVSMQTLSSAATSGIKQVKLNFAYDVQGRRVRKQVSTWNGTVWTPSSDLRFAYDGGWNLLAEFDGLNDDAILRAYTWGLDLSGSLGAAAGLGGLMFENLGGSSYAPDFDGDGNIVEIRSLQNGNLLGAFDYGPYGEVLQASGAVAAANPFKGSTKYADPETSFVYYGYRYYDSNMGRWIGRDPIEEQGGKNLYNFVRNNPIMLSDILGLRDLTSNESEAISKLQDMANSPTTSPDYSKALNTTISDFQAMVASIKNDETDPVRVRILDSALAIWADSKAASAFVDQGAGHNKCNLFVKKVLQKASVSTNLVVDRQDPHGRAPLAGEWAGSEPIASFKIIYEVTDPNGTGETGVPLLTWTQPIPARPLPKMGDIVAMYDGKTPPTEPDAAHVGIYFGDGLFMSASYHGDPTGSGLQNTILIQTLVDGYNHLIFRSSGP